MLSSPFAPAQVLPLFLAQRLHEAELAGALEPFAAVDGDHLAVDVGGAVRDQEGGEVGQLAVRANPAERNSPQPGRFDFLVGDQKALGSFSYH